MEAQSVTFKVHFPGELRRFTIPKDDLTFDRFLKFIKEEDEKVPRLRYTDDEGDKVDVSSTAELLEAASNAGGAPVHVYVGDDEDKDTAKPDEASSGAPPGAAGAFDPSQLIQAALANPQLLGLLNGGDPSQLLNNPQVQQLLQQFMGAQARPAAAAGDAPMFEAESGDTLLCDECTATISGVAYQCGNCDEYDLCSECYQSRSGKHAEDHQFYTVHATLEKVQQLGHVLNFTNHELFVDLLTASNGDVAAVVAKLSDQN